MKKVNVIIVFAMVILLSACKAYEYTAPAHIVPLHQKKGELKTNVNLIGLQNSYSFSDHFFVFQTANYRSSLEVIKSGESSEKRFLDDQTSLELGIGYYYPVNKLRIELLAGSGYNDFNYAYKSYGGLENWSYDLHSDRWSMFIQPNLGYKLDKFTEIALFSRVSYLNYDNLRVDWRLNGEFHEPVYDLKSPTFNGLNYRNFYFFEPGFVCRVGWENIKVQCEISKTFQLSKSPIIYRDLNVQVGIFLDLDIIKGAD